MQELPLEEKKSIVLIILGYHLAVMSLAKLQGCDSTIVAPTTIYEALFLMERLTENDIEKIITLVQSSSDSGLSSFFSFYEELKILSSSLHLNLQENWLQN
ncbi:MAG: hypothetical protein F6K48_13050 [Okeania sp. SIO3H1]|nr:hypothetical protein [Okeania sp. SIO3H1]